jgi:hypothetical protein
MLTYDVSLVAIRQQQIGLYMEKIITTLHYLCFLARHFPENPLATLYEYCL